MTGRLVRIAFAGLCSATLAGCSKPSPAPAPAPAPAPTVATLHIFGPGSIEIPENCPGNPAAPKTIFKILIKNNFLLKAAKVDKATHKPKQTGGEYDEDGGATDGLYRGNPNMTVPTRMDIGTGLAIGEAAMIKVVLKDTDLKFRADDAAIRAGDPGGAAIFCHVRFNAARDTVRFWVVKPGGTTPTQGTYNLGIIVKDSTAGSGFSLPVFIDPGADNEG